MHRPLYWHQGLFLQPQHFQLSDLHTQSLLMPFNKFITPYFWGVGEQVIQETALGNLIFNLTRGEYLFPDMTHVVFPGNAILEARSFEESWIEGGKPLTVYIGLKRLDTSKENVTVLSKMEDIFRVPTRFVTLSDPDEVDNMYQIAPKAQVKHLNYALKIFWETEKEELGEYELIPVAQLVRTGDEISLSRHYAPPNVRMAGCEPLMQIVKEIRDQISARAHQLEEYKEDRGIHSAEFGSRDMVYLLALRSLTRYVPQLFHITDVLQVHPWSVYGCLRQLIGELTAFSERVNMLGELADGTPLLKPYDHKNLYPCFLSAQGLVTQLLDEITAGPEYVIELEYDGTYYSAELPPSIFEGRNRFFLVMDTETDPKFVLQSLETVIKLCSRESLPILIARALPGIRMEHLPVPPQELPRRAHSIYFQLDHHSDYWSQVEKGHNMALYWDTAPDDLRVELMVVGRS
jgi:type VI secretion system protein ImpJ